MVERFVGATVILESKTRQRTASGEFSDGVIQISPPQTLHPWLILALLRM